MTLIMIIFIVAIPFIVGINSYKFIPEQFKENIEIIVNDRVSIKSSKNIIYIGKTHDYIFFREVRAKRNRIFPISEVNELIIR